MSDTVGAVSELANTVISRLWPDKTEQQRQEIAAAIIMMQGQNEINIEEAKSPSMFVSGWRPFVGWICAAAFAWNLILLKIAMFIAAAFGYNIDLEPADISELMPVLLGMLGLGGLRTYEKMKGVASVTHR